MNKAVKYIKSIIKKIIFKKSQDEEITDELFSRDYIDLDSMDNKDFSQQDLEKTMLKGCKVLEELGVKSWVGRGTLLGFYRDNKFLPKDKDIDIDVYTDKEVYKIIKNMPFEEIVLATIHGGRYMQLAFLDKETDVIFDIWFYHEKDKKIINRNYYGHFWLPVEKLEKLTTIVFNGHKYFIPDPDWYCEFWYGKDWKTPKKYSAHWTEDYKKDCKGFIYTGTKHVRGLIYYK